jgi:hypothetical protein
LGSGFPQGNGPSPNQFNICEQILLFKIELCPEIRSIFNKVSPALARDGLPVLGPVPVAVPVPAQAPLPVPVLDVPPPLAMENNVEITNRIVDLNIYGRFESNRETDKVEAFADDNTVLALLDEPALVNVKQILQDFGIISGLKCNVDKSVIMIIGSEEPQQIPDFVTNSGFAVVEEVKILGVKFTKNADDITQNFDSSIEKI